MRPFGTTGTHQFDWCHVSRIGVTCRARSCRLVPAHRGPRCLRVILQPIRGTSPWIPAFAGMTIRGARIGVRDGAAVLRIPAFAGMTRWGAGTGAVERHSGTLPRVATYPGSESGMCFRAKTVRRHPLTPLPWIPAFAMTIWGACQ